MDTSDEQQKGYDRYQEKLKFEHDLINRRLTWLLTSQTIMFAALAIAFKEGAFIERREAFLKFIPYMGGAIALLIFSGVLAGSIAKYTVWKDHINKNQEYQKQWGVRNWITQWALITDLLLPVVFAITWLLIGLG